MISNIMLIDDDEISNFIAEKLLKRMNVCDSITVVLNGSEAKKYLLESSELPQFALLDINMPLMNGFEFMSWFDQSNLKGQCKFFFYSTSIRTEDKEQAINYSDVIEYVEKPLTEDKVHRIIQMFQKNKKYSDDQQFPPTA